MSKFIPVIHIESSVQVLRNAFLAKECGCDGCFLIDHHGSRVDLLNMYALVKNTIPNWWVGINDLSRTGPDVFEDLDPVLGCAPTPDAVWMDNLRISEFSEEQPDAAALWQSKQGLLFGGVAFKYQDRVHDLSKVAKIAVNYCDVVTTSGDKTGMPPTVEKIRTIKEAIGDKPLAIASGITEKNIVDYLEYTEYFLVATGISSSEASLDRDKVLRMRELI